MQETPEAKPETERNQALDPIAVGRDEGEARWWFGLLAVIKATAADTGGQMTIVEITNLPGWEGPLHVHHMEDEGFWILEGDTTIEVGERTIHASEGDYVFGPRHIPHRYTVGDSGCRMLFIFTPGGVENLIRETSEPAGSLTVPPRPRSRPTWSGSRRSPRSTATSYSSERARRPFCAARWGGGRRLGLADKMASVL